MYKETYERLRMDVTEFDIEDVITTSEPEPINKPAFTNSKYEMSVGRSIGIPDSF